MRWVTVRFTFLMAAQLIVNMIASQVFNWYTPGILSLLALCAVLAVPLGRLTTLALFAIFAVLVLTPFALTSIFAIDGAWTAVITAENLGEWLGLLFIDGTYPLLPWFAFFVLGAIIHDVDRKKVGMFLALSGCFSLITLLIAVLTDEAWALPNGDALLTFFPANSAFMITATFSVLAGVLLLQKCRPEFYSRPVTSSFLLTGRISLTIYLLHFIPLRIIDGMGYEPSSTGIAIAAVFGYMLLWWPLAILHHRYAKDISLEALLRRLSTPPSGNDS